LCHLFSAQLLPEIHCVGTNERQNKTQQKLLVTLSSSLNRRIGREREKRICDSVDWKLFIKGTSYLLHLSYHNTTRTHTHNTNPIFISLAFLFPKRFACCCCLAHSIAPNKRLGSENRIECEKDNSSNSNNKMYNCINDDVADGAKINSMLRPCLSQAGILFSY